MITFIKPLLTLGLVLFFAISCSDDSDMGGGDKNESIIEIIPAPDAGGTAGAVMPYVRYDSEEAELAGGAKLNSSPDFDRTNIASQASRQTYIALPTTGSYAEWVVATEGDGVTMRFTMPDSPDGYGLDGSLDIYVNDSKATTVELTSYYMWQYFKHNQNNASEIPGDEFDMKCFAFDEVHFRLPSSLKAGDRIRVQNSGDGGLEYGVDFLEIEPVPAPISAPSNSIICADGDINAAIATAKEQGMNIVYLPEGTWTYNSPIIISESNVKITGAGIWHTNIKFTSSERGGGGIIGNCSGVELCHMYINSNLRSRYNQDAQYKCFSGYWGRGSVIHDVWEEHFECGFWIADYVNYKATDYMKIINCRLRNNLADGLNFCLGTSYSTVYNCSVRNNGDDGLAMWNYDYRVNKDEYANVFCYNTIEFNWRAGCIAIYGGDRHWIYNNYMCDTYLAAGIHLNGYFDGFRFGNTVLILFENNTLVRCGSKADIFGTRHYALSVEDNHPRNVAFRNTTFYGSQAGDVRIMGDNVTISGSNFPPSEPLSPAIGTIQIEYKIPE